jgi:hypothetical protein
MASDEVNIGTQFSKYPAGRTREDGPFSGQYFREDFLQPLLSQGKHFRVLFDDALGAGSSFLEEAFGGLVRLGFTAKEIFSKIEFVTKDEVLLDEIKHYITDEAKRLGR